MGAEYGSRAEEGCRWGGRWGRGASGGWSYSCPSVGEAEVRRLTAHLRGVELKGRSELPKLPAKGKRKVEDLPKEIQLQLGVIARMAPPVHPGLGSGDNSNTQ